MMEKTVLGLKTKENVQKKMFLECATFVYIHLKESGAS